MRYGSNIHLLRKFLEGHIADPELKSLFRWLNSEKGHLEYEMWLNDKWISTDSEYTTDVDSSALFYRVAAGLRQKQVSDRKRFFIRLGNLAAVFILGFLIPLSYLVIMKPRQINNQQIIVRESLSNEKVRKIVLPDRTTAWLMSGSEISYPRDFSGCKSRNVEIIGEAFFDVAEDPSLPFILNLGEVGLKVVGTSFSVSNYKDEDQIRVALQNGRVDLFKGEYDPDYPFVQLHSGQLGIYKRGATDFTVCDTDITKYVSWIDGTLLFRDDPLSDVLKKLGRWYNIPVEITAVEVSDFPFTATIKNENIEQVVDLLAYSTPFGFRLYKDRLVISRKSDK